MSFPPPRKRHPYETEEEWNHVIKETKQMKHLFQLKHDMTQQQLTGDLNGDSDNDIKYSNMTLQHNQHFHAEQIVQCNKNDASISFPNDKMNEVDEQGIKNQSITI